MIDAKVLATYRKPPSGGSAGTLYLYGTWIPRGGDNLRVTLESVVNQGAKLDVRLYHKNFGDPGNGAVVSASLITFDGTTGRSTQEWTGLKELVRFWVSLAPTASVAKGRCGLVLYRFLQPVWFETVVA